MKKIIVLILSISLLTVLFFVTMNLSEKQGKSDTELIEFAIQDISTVDRVIITDKFDNEFELLKKGTIWTDKNGGCITQTKVDHVIDAFKNIEFKGYLTDKSKKRFTNLMAAQNIKVEIFQNGEWTKTWYLGPSSQDHLGQIMLLDDKEYGKSAFPVVMSIKNMKGIIDPRFYSDPLQWMCQDMISLQLPDISMVKVKFNDEPLRSFKVTKQGSTMKVFQDGKQLQGVEPTAIYNYLSNFQDVNFNVANYELNVPQMDSLKATTPFCELTVKNTKGTSETFKLYRIINKSVGTDVGMAEVINTDLDRFWCVMPAGNLVKCQYFVFNPLILGHAFFPFDLEGLTTHDGITPIEE